MLGVELACSNGYTVVRAGRGICYEAGESKMGVLATLLSEQGRLHCCQSRVGSIFLCFDSIGMHGLLISLS